MQKAGLIKQIKQNNKKLEREHEVAANPPIRVTTIQRCVPPRSHKAWAPSAGWHLDIKSCCFWARWPYCWSVLSNLFLDASIAASWRAKGDVASFPFSNVLAWLNPGGLQLPHSLLYFVMEPSSGDVCRFVCEQPPDAFEFQFY